jgi:hypothetical protein
MPVDVSPVGTPELPVHIAGREHAPNVDERRAAWYGKGTAHDRAVRRKLSVAVPILMIVAAVTIDALL